MDFSKGLLATVTIYIDTTFIVHFKNLEPQKILCTKNIVEFLILDLLQKAEMQLVCCVSFSSIRLKLTV